MSEVRTDDPFAAAFEKLSALGAEAPPAETDAAMAAADEQKPVEQPPAEGEQSVAEGQEGQEQPPAEGEQPVAEGEQPPAEGEQPKEPEPAAESDDALLRRLSDLVRKAPAEEKPAPAEKPAETEPEAPIYTQEEQELLQAYEKDWPDVAKAEALRRRAEYKQLATFIFQEVGQYLRPHIEALQTVATRTHLSDLEAQVPDYDDVRDKVVDWVGTQPKYLQTAYERVINEGTVEEVADLIGRWRQATGVTQQAAPSAAPARNTALPPATKQAAAALAPVGSKRSAPAAGVDPADFDGAFAVAAAGKD